MPAPIVLTCGEPAGIGPELAPHALNAGVPVVWIGDPDHLPRGTAWQAVDAPSQPVPAGSLPVLVHRFARPAQPGEPDPANAAGVIEVIARAVDLARSAAAGGICTLPISKQALKQGADFPFPGHTEYLAHLAGGCDVAMMLASTTVEPPCRVVPATIHIPLDQVPEAFTRDALTRALRITHAALIRDFGIERPRLAVAGLNPHAGEGGTMGRAEIDWMIPALEALRGEGMTLLGPLPADTMFHASARARWDAAICAYHDQGLIPIKTLDFAGGVNVTLGLPFVRTSPDHGTAFDIAGRGIADPASTIAALRMAWDMAVARARA
ncbi:4-hydroxythreonine-4-phosphate dehydrogenase PdxA [uncultured Paracoccus sp.]|uniref:4-hydroxythreonine-4-phosphate dehydrogenase PdxA n=1 Tax=uncultured Paracoccus sp. TaxID=189685 RepID=UPI00260B4B4D|nr:4-hydroxythreonine-4-phosphate dehydrogenase PdxA [uncultured Paracoccus sp.]